MNEVSTKFTEAEILKDTKLKDAPSEIVEVKYADKEVNLGNELTPLQVKDCPVLKWNFVPGKYYTILMTDLDPPSRSYPILREIRHWLVMNVQNNDVAHGDTVDEYSGAGPPKIGGMHRYVFVIFEQKEKIATEKLPKPGSMIGRMRTSTKALVEEFNLGQPKYGNFFHAQYDESVSLHMKKRMGDFFDPVLRIFRRN